MIAARFINGLDLLAVIAVIALLFAGWTYGEWRADDRERRSRRLVRRNLYRQTGGRR